MEREGVARVQVEVVGERRPELLLMAEQFPGTALWVLTGRMLPVDRTSQGMTSHERNFPGDLWIARRNRWALAMLSVVDQSRFRLLR